MNAATTEGRVKKRRGIRKPVSCTECRRRKLKCDKDLPCNSCIKRGIPDSCVYNSELPNRGSLLQQHHQQVQQHQPHIHQQTGQRQNNSLYSNSKIRAASPTSAVNPPYVRELLKGTATDPSHQREISSMLSNFVNGATAATTTATTATTATTTTTTTTTNIPAKHEVTVPMATGDLSSASRTAGLGTLPMSTTFTLMSDNGQLQGQSATSRVSSLLPRDGYSGPIQQWDSFGRVGLAQTQNEPPTPPIQPPSTTTAHPSLPTSNNNHSEYLNGFPFFDSPVVSSRIELLNSLPDRSVCDYLLDRYFHVFSDLFPILHEPMLRQDYEQLFTEHRTSLPLSLIALIYITFGLAMITVDENDSYLTSYWGYLEGPRVEEIVQTFLTQAKKCLVTDNFMVHHSLTTLQALILLIYALSLSPGSGGVASWPLLGMAFNIGVTLGCHVDGSRLNISFYEVEQRRRSWTGLMLMDMFLTSASGRPSMLNRACFNTQLPRNMNDDELTESSDGTSKIYSSTESSAIPPQRLTQVTYLNLKVRFYELTNALFSNMLDMRTVTYQQVRDLDSKIVEHRKMWDRVYLSSNKFESRVYHFVQYDILYIYLNHSYLLLHRPHYYTEPFSRQRCINASFEVISRIQNFCYDERYKPFKFYARGLGAFHCFHATTVLAVIVIENQKKLSSTTTTATNDDLTNQQQQEAFSRFETALNLLMGLAPRSFIAKKSVEVLLQIHQRLSEMYTPSITYPGVHPATSDAAFQLDNFTIAPIITNVRSWIGPRSFDWLAWDSVISHPIQ
ncbi:hypothetical protein TRICI_004481 [Trichomonascus ciferrii]|uniref:Zn(2)-C6 fungal-type domain-containing protein n=1 Tax=Trichomonascus ciferrii TaxID=44093 RepID=A0A642V077_9ASCO|nr:hypothetical protein TRICI_004481 [Trichomonascus ciferrii]